LNDTTSAEKAAQVDGTRSDHRLAANHTNGTPGECQAGRISEAWPLTFPALFFWRMASRGNSAGL